MAALQLAYFVRLRRWIFVMPGLELASEFASGRKGAGHHLESWRPHRLTTNYEDARNLSPANSSILATMVIGEKLPPKFIFLSS
jgi:hypothetical protein